MSIKRLFQSQAPSSSAAQYTANKSTQIYAATVCNPTGSADTLSVWLVPSLGTDVDATAIYHEESVAAGANFSLSLLSNHVLEAGDRIFTRAGTSATALTVTVSGREV